MDMRGFLPALSLVVLTTFFVEFVVGRSIISFLDPGTLIFLFVGYGVTILLLREFAVRYDLGLKGLILWGVAYGIINEGLLAKTMIKSVDLPVSLYDHYGVALGISWPWSMAIALWHAFAAVVFPILFIHTVFPQHKDKQWLGKRTAWIASGVLLVLLCFIFLADAPVKGTLVQLIVFLVLIAALIALGIRFKGSWSGSAPVTSRQLLLGLSVIIPFWVLAIIARLQLPILLFVAVFAAVIITYAMVLRRTGWDALPAFLCFGMGFYLHNVLQAGIILSVTNPLIALGHTVVSVAVLAVLWRRGCPA